MRWARIFGAIGRTLIGVGLLLLLFVAYQLWGTGIQHARAQDRLGDEFAAALEAVSTTTTELPSTSSSSRPARPVTTSTTLAAPIAPPREGDPVAEIKIPAIGVKQTVIEGVSVGNLKEGPGHYPQTPLPGQAGNAAIAGHRTTYGAPFYDLNEVEIGDEIVVRTLQGTFTYVVDGKQIVRPDQVEVLDPTEEPRLTLTTCEPRFSARQRLIVTGVLQDEPAPSPASTAGPTAEPTGTDDEPVIVEIDGAGLSGDPSARWPTFWWGLLAAIAGVETWRLARGFGRRWIYAAGAPVFFLVLFVFFENVSRLLPANI